MWTQRTLPCSPKRNLFSSEPNLRLNIQIRTSAARTSTLRLSRPNAFRMATKVQKIMTQPINLIFRFLQSKQRIQIWLYDQVRLCG